MGSLALLLIVVGAFLIYEVAKNTATTDATSSAGGGSTGGSASSPPTSLSTSGQRLFPQRFYDAIAASESGGYNAITNPFTGRSSYSYFGVSGSGSAGSLRVPSGVIAMYSSPQEAFDAFDRTLQESQYSSAMVRYKQSGNLCQFVADIAPVYQHGSSTPTEDSNIWTHNIQSLLGC